MTDNTAERTSVLERLDKVERFMDAHTKMHLDRASGNMRMVEEADEAMKEQMAAFVEVMKSIDSNLLDLKRDVKLLADKQNRKSSSWRPRKDMYSGE